MFLFFFEFRIFGKGSQRQFQKCAFSSSSDVMYGRALFALDSKHLHAAAMQAYEH